MRLCKFQKAILAMLMLLASAARASDVHVAVASNFSVPMKALVAAFEAVHDLEVLISTGSSGKLYAQIHHGAPYDLFFSADQDKPERLERDNRIKAGSRFTYAVGQLALMRADSRAVLGKPTLKKMIQHAQIRRIALANPRLAPYGAAASDVLESLGLKEETQSRWVVGENVAQVYQFVRTGNADIGFVALSQVMGDSAPQNIRYLRIDSKYHQAIRQDVVLLNSDKATKAAGLFWRFVQSKAARDIIKSYGYGLPRYEEMAE